MTKLRVPIRVKVQVTILEPGDDTGAGKYPDVEWVQDAHLDLIYDGLKGATEGEVLTLTSNPR